MYGVLQLMRSIVAVTLFIGFLAGPAAGMGTAPRLPQITIEGPEANFSPALLGVGSVFMKIVNTGNGGDELVSARTDIANTIVELHDVKDGKMAKVDKIRIPSGSAVELKPRGLHIMVFKLPKEIREGSEFTLSLVFEKSGEKKIPLKFAKPSGPHMQHYH